MFDVVVVVNIFTNPEQEHFLGVWGGTDSDYWQITATNE